MLKKTTIFLLIASMFLVLTIIVILIVRSPSSQTKTQTVPILPNSLVVTTSTLTQPNLETASKAKQTLLPKLPIEINSFETSVGLKPDILISSYNNDDPDVVRIEVFGVDYNYNQNDPTTNPNMIAYKESFERVISLLKENNVDIKDLHILLSNKQYIRDVAEGWIKALNLLP